MSDYPHPDDLVDEGKLERALKRLGFTASECASLVGMSPVAFNKACAAAPRGWRAKVETALDLEPGSLRLKI